MYTYIIKEIASAKMIVLICVQTKEVIEHTVPNAYVFYKNEVVTIVNGNVIH